MKGFAENTIPQRQYENIKVRYYFENETEKEEALEACISDCIKYKDVVGDRIRESANLVTLMEPEEVVKFYNLPAGTKLKRVFNKDTNEHLYFDMKSGIHYNHPTKE